MAMTAASQTLPGLEVTAPDDDMEITSDLGRPDDDIDIDIDISGDYQRDPDEDFILEDVRSEAGLDSHQATYADNNDDIMLDGENDNVEDGIMRDDITVPDEHLTDVSEIVQEDVASANVANDVDTINFVDYEFDEEVPRQADHGNDFNPEETDAVYEQTLDNMASTTTDPQGHTEDIQAASSRSTSPPLQDYQEPHPLSKPTLEIDESNKSSEITNDQGFAQVNPEQEDEVRQLSGHASPVLEGKEAEQAHQQDYSQEQLEHNQKVYERITDPVNSMSQGDTFQAPSSSLHPVIVTYLDNEISLFPPREQDQSETFFLQDESIAHETIGDLLQACRTVLGETIREEDELEMDIADLGLCISEDCVHASAICFSQILDVYTLLHQQDGTPSPDPLYVTLSTKTRFSSRFDQLNAAALEGKGISQLTFLGEPEENGSEYPAQDVIESEQEERASGETPGSENSEQANAETQNTKREPQSPAQEDDGPPTPELQKSTEKGEVARPREDNADFEHGTDIHPEDGHKDSQVTDAIAGVTGESVEEKIHPETPEEPGEDDLIDYDDGDEEDHAQGTESSESGPSSGSSTIQGDPSGSPQYSEDPEVDNQADSAENGSEGPGNSENSGFAEDNADTAPSGYSYHDFAGENSHPEVDNQGHEQNYEYEVQSEVLEPQPKSPHQGLPLEQEYEHGGNTNDYNDERYSNQNQSFQEEDHNLSGHDQSFPDEDAYDYRDHFPPDTHRGDKEPEDFEDPEHGDFDYPEFNDDHAEPDVEDSSHPEHVVVQPDDGLYDQDSDAIDYEDDEDESPPKALKTVPQSPRYHPSASPPAKRSWAEHEGGLEDPNSGLDTKRMRSR